MDPASVQNKPDFHADQTFGAIGGRETTKKVEPPHPPANLIGLSKGRTLRVKKPKGHPNLGGKEAHDKLEENKEVRSQIPEEEREKLQEGGKVRNIHTVDRNVSTNSDVARMQLLEGIMKFPIERSLRPIDSKAIPSTFVPPEPKHQIFTRGHPNARHMLYDQRGTDSRNFQPGQRGSEY